MSPTSFQTAPPRTRSLLTLFNDEGYLQKIVPTVISRDANYKDDRDLRSSDVGSRDKFPRKGRPRHPSINLLLCHSDYSHWSLRAHSHRLRQDCQHLTCSQMRYLLLSMPFFYNLVSQANRYANTSGLIMDDSLGYGAPG